MKAVAMEEFGLDNDLVKYDDFDKPEVGEEDVLIEVEYVGISPYDWHVREGEQEGKRDFPIPLILGWDISGRIKAIGDNVEVFEIDDEVIALQDLERHGGYAEYTSVPAEHVVKKPVSLSFEEAAAIPINAVTVYQSLIKTAQIKEGDNVLIHGGAGGVGVVAIQLAKLYETYVATTASPHNHEFLKSIGADETIDYNEENFENVVSDYDVVLDTQGGDTLERSYGVLKNEGRLISIRSQINKRKADDYNVEASFVSMDINHEDLEAVVKLYGEEKIKSYIDTVFPLSQANEAHEHSQEGHARGKIVLKIKE